MAKKINLATAGLYLLIGAVAGYILRGAVRGIPMDIPAGFHYVPSPQYTCDMWNKCSPA